MKVDRIGARDERAVVMVGIEQLRRERLPAASRTPVEEARPALADAAKPILDRWNELGLDGIPIGSEVG